MKYLYYFENYAQSEKFGNPLTEEEFQKLYYEHCKNHKKNKENSEASFGLWRGIRQDKVIFTKNPEIVAYYQNPKGHIRESIENINIHVTIMSENEHWKDFPPYNQSVIASTSFMDAYDYGKLFEVIPFDNTRIGVCANENVWEAFGGFHSEYSNPIYIVGHFLRILNVPKTASWLSIKGYIRTFINDKLYDEISRINKTVADRFIIMLYEWDKNNILEWVYKKTLTDKEIENYISTIDWNKVVDFIEELFKPKQFGFHSITYDTKFKRNIRKYFKDYSSEKLQVWCEGPVLLKKSFQY